MSSLRLLLMVTWAAWLWMELVLVFGPTLRDRLLRRGRSQDAGSAAVVLVCVCLAFGGAIALSRQPFGGIPGPAPVLLSVGLALMWLGLALRAWAIHHLGGLFRAVVVIRPDHRLVTTGPYRYVRHPSYSGALVAAAGFGLALGHWTSLLVVVAGWAAGLAYRMRVEEAALRSAFGPAYDDYCARTRRLVPLLF